MVKLRGKKTISVRRLKNKFAFYLILSNNHIAGYCRRFWGPLNRLSARQHIIAPSVLYKLCYYYDHDGYSFLSFSPKAENINRVCAPATV